MTSTLNIDDDPLMDAIAEIIEICDERFHDGDKLADIRRVAIRAVVLEERSRYILPEGSC